MITPQFWMVYREGEQSPTKKHETDVDALAEASCLARQHPGTRFYIMAAKYFVETAQPAIEIQQIGASC